MSSITRHRPLFLPAGACGVGIILALDADRFVMQLREDKAGVAMAGYWGLFGGAPDIGETTADAAVRELKEETALEGLALTPLISLRVDMGPVAPLVFNKHYFTAAITDADLDSARLGEGAALAALRWDELTDGRPVIPNDLYAIALWRDHRSGRLTPQRVLGAPAPDAVTTAA